MHKMRNLAIAVTVALASGVAFAATTYTWTGAGDGLSWNDPANWGQTVNYPSSTAYSAKFTSNASVILDSDTTIYSMEIASGVEVALAGAGEGVKLTLNNGFTWNGGLRLDSLFLYRNADLTPGAAASLSLVNGAKFQCNTLKLLSGQPLSLAYGSWASVNELHVNDPSTTVTIDDSTLIARSHFYCGSTTAPGGGRFVFKGAHPVFEVRGGNFRTTANATAWTAGFDWDFEIPLGGYAAPPVVATAAQLFGSMASTTHQNRFNVLATSPALTAGTRLETVLVHAPAGIVRARAEGTSASAPVSFAAMSGAAATTDATAQRLVVTVNPSSSTPQTPAAVTTAQLPSLAPSGTVARRKVTANYQVMALANDGTTTRATLEGGTSNDTSAFTDGDSAILTAPGKYSNLSWTAPKRTFQTCYFRIRFDQIDASGSVVATVYSDVFSATTVDSATYTWRPVNGDWNGSVTNRAHWACDAADDDRYDWPSHTSSKAIVPSGTVMAISVPAVLASGTWTFSAGSDTTFVPDPSVLTPGVASTNVAKITVASIVLDYTGGSLTVDGVALVTTANVTLGAQRALRVVGGGNMYMGSLVAEKTASSVAVRDESWLCVNDFRVGAGAVVISNATVCTRAQDYIGSTSAGGSIRFEGDHPLWYHSGTGGSFCSTLANAGTTLDFLVPAGGYLSAPIQAKAAQSYYMGDNKGNAGSSAITVNVLDESPANFSGTTLTTPLVSWPKGINKTLVQEGHLPQDNGAATDDAFVWIDAGATYPARLCVALTGDSHAGDLQVTGFPSEIAAAISPGYGYTAVASGNSIVCSAPSGTVALTATNRATCVGWKLYQVDAATLGRTLVDSGNGTTCTFTGDSTWHVLEWQWRPEYKIDFTVSGGGTVSTNGGWYADGEVVTAIASANPGSAFQRWAGNVPAGLAHETRIAFAADAPRTITALFGQILHVSPSGNNANNGSSWSAAYATVPAAVAAAASGDTILVSNGVYLVTAQITLDKGVTIRGAGASPADVVIRRSNGSATHRILELASPDALVENLTLAYGKVSGTDAKGGNVLISSGGTLSKCIVRDGFITSGQRVCGAGLYVASSAGLVRDCLITQNIVSDNNSLGGSGAGMSAGRIENCLIVNNRQTSKNISTQPNSNGAVYMSGGTLASCTVSGNSHHLVAGVYATGGSVVNTVIAGNYSRYSTDTDRVWGGSAAPFRNCVSDAVQINSWCLREDVAFADAAGGDYTPPATSACVDAAIPDGSTSDHDFAGNARVSGAAADIGAIERQKGVNDADLSIGTAFSSPLSSLEVVFSAEASGLEDVASYAWSFGDGSSGTGATPAHTYAEPGAYAVTLAARDGGGRTIAEAARTVYVAGDTIYVTASSSAAAQAAARRPYATAATAATNINDAILSAVDGQTIVLLAGTHMVHAPVRLEKALTIRGVGDAPGATVVSPLNAASSIPMHVRHHVFQLLDAGSRVENLVVANGYNSSNLEGGGVFIGPRGGMVTNCVLRGNQVYVPAAQGGGIYMRGGVASHCVITNNITDDNGSKGGAGAAIYGGRMENCLLARNRSALSSIAGREQQIAAGGVYLGGGSLVNCTVAGNRSLNVGGIYAAAGQAVNCLIAGNTSEGSAGAATAMVYDGNAALFSSCVSEELLINGDCLRGPALLDDGFRPLPASIAVNAGRVPEGGLEETDLDGNPRVSGGLPDAGCFEYQLSGLSVAFTAVEGEGIRPFAATFSATALGASGSVSYAWDFGDGQTLTTTEPLVAHTYESAGNYTVTVVASDGVSAPASYTVEGCVRVRPAVIHVDASNDSPAEPYDTWANAASSLVAACDYAIAGCAVLLAPGRHVIASEIVLDRAVAVVGDAAAPEKVVVARNTSKSLRLFTLNHSDAVLTGVALENGNKASVDFSGYGGGALLIAPKGGVATNCIIRNSTATTGYQRPGSGGGVYIAGPGLVANCVITNNLTPDQNSLGGSGVYVTGGGVIANCLIADNRQVNSSPDNQTAAGGLRVHDGAAINCTVVSNSLNHVSGLYCESAGAVTNCIIAGNYPVVATGVSYAVNGGVNNGFFVNCATDGYLLNGTCVAGDLRFVDAPGRNYRLAVDSPACDSGSMNLPEAMLCLDLDGNPRVLHRVIDIGCYEHQWKSPGTMIIMR